MNRLKLWMPLFLILSTLCAPADAGWRLRENGVEVKVAKGHMHVTPVGDWNRWTSRPSKRGEIWTADGLSLNELSFFARIRNGEPIYREFNKKDNPLPKFKSRMLPTDLTELFETSNRILLQTSLFEIEDIEPAKLGGHDAVRFRYNYTVSHDELKRRGEAVFAIVDGELYIANFVASAIHYFDHDIDDVRQMLSTIRLSKNK